MLATAGEPRRPTPARGQRRSAGPSSWRRPAPQPGVAPVHLVSRPAIERAARGEVPEGCSADDPRANLVLDLDGDERAWVGRELRVGRRRPGGDPDAEALPRRLRRGAAPGRITVGDAVLL